MNTSKDTPMTTKESEVDVLLPCPFCGHAELFDQWPCEWLDGSGANVVRCPMCHGAAPAKYWNTRTALRNAGVKL